MAGSRMAIGFQAFRDVGEMGSNGPLQVLRDALILATAIDRAKNDAADTGVPY